jgi:hypothetical protein
MTFYCYLHLIVICTKMPSEQNFRSIFSTFLSNFRSVGLGMAAILVFGLVWHVSQPVAHAQAVQSEHVIFISVDGLRSDVLTSLGPDNLPAFYRLMNEGSSTLNARNDPDYTITLPNHTSMLTGRFVSGSAGHNWTKNTDPTPAKPYTRAPVATSQACLTFSTTKG